METVPWPAHSADLNLIEALWLDLEPEMGEDWRHGGNGGMLENRMGDDP